MAEINYSRSVRLAAALIAIDNHPDDRGSLPSFEDTEERRNELEINYATYAWLRMLKANGDFETLREIAFGGLIPQDEPVLSDSEKRFLNPPIKPEILAFIRMRGAPVSLTEVRKTFRISKQAARFWLRELCGDELVDRVRKGRWIYYAPSESSGKSSVDWLDSVFCGLVRVTENLEFAIAICQQESLDEILQEAVTDLKGTRDDH